ncbi:Non-structural maintenance of chromosome element 3 [Pseudocercospora fuligena]|uniref:Non-structural maintenance of chromosome element 3 n=1 Tax=Pseudocercospora fuligena TaxID=685502 RepID=A0A8H6VGZ3_9PEZI|nr:Non-structural maintenance of chromosome element 3 [Pseudocercospora fuligena]
MPLVQGRKRRVEAQDEESPEGSPEPQTQRRRTTGDDLGQDESFGGDEGGQTQDVSLDEMAKKMVRLALSCELARRPIRRQEVGEKVLGANNRMFKRVFDQAQMHLNGVFGMEMVELPSRERLTVQQRRAAQKKDSQPTKSGTTSWILRSILPPNFHDPIILQPSFAPTPRDEAQYTGIYTVLVSAIMMAGGQLNNDKMERYLQRLKIDDQTPVVDYEKNERLMKRMEKDGYIARVKESSGTGEDDIYWIVGPRGKIEVGEDGVRGITTAVYAPKTEEEEEELERKVNRSLGIAQPSRSEVQPVPQQNGEGSRRTPKSRARGSAAQREAAEDEGEDDDSQIEYEDEDE